MATETIFDAASTDLRGRLVIEASAGTGKTWSLSRIVMRLVAEEGFPIGSILLVTFTKAATEELKSRVKELPTPPTRCRGLTTGLIMTLRILRPL